MLSLSHYWKCQWQSVRCLSIQHIDAFTSKTPQKTIISVRSRHRKFFQCRWNFHWIYKCFWLQCHSNTRLRWKTLKNCHNLRHCIRFIECEPIKSVGKHRRMIPKHRYEITYIYCVILRGDIHIQNDHDHEQKTNKIQSFTYAKHVVICRNNGPKTFFNHMGFIHILYLRQLFYVYKYFYHKKNTIRR